MRFACHQLSDNLPIAIIASTKESRLTGFPRCYGDPLQKWSQCTLLAEAHAKTERAQAMAEKTKSGFVYVISNIGSFGEDVVKIGLTRRLDPSDRVREMGDASVPFLFDTDAMIYSEEAPALEAALHSEFAEQRINAANMRKEFFRVTLKEVEEAVQRLAPDADFHTDIEAQGFYETLAKRKELAERLAESDARELPVEI